MKVYDFADDRLVDWKPGESAPEGWRLFDRKLVRDPDTMSAPEFKGDKDFLSEAFRGRIEWAKRETQYREMAYADVLKDTGKIATIERFLDQRKAESQMLLLSDSVADRMTRLGLGGYRSVSDPVWVYGVHSGETYELPNYRRNKFIPAICHEKRANHVNELEYFIRKHPFQCRMIVVSGGPHGEKGRVQSLFVTDRWHWQNKRINAFNKSHIARRFGAQIVFRANELGSPLKKDDKKQYVRDSKGRRIRNVDENGCQTYHPHTHGVLFLKGKLSKAEWNKFILFLQGHFDQAKPDAGFITDAREACKYMAKCDELMELRNMDFMRIFRRLNSRRLIATYGPLKKQLLHHEENVMKLRRRSSADGEQLELFPVKNWNRKPLSFKADEYKMPKLKDTEEPICVARCAPSSRFTPVSEPCLVFRGPVAPRLAEQDRVAVKVRERTSKAWEAGEKLFKAQHGCDALTWSIEVAPLQQAASAVAKLQQPLPLRISAHTTPATFEATEIPAELSTSGVSSLSGDGAKPPPIATESQFFDSPHYSDTEKPRRHRQPGSLLFRECEHVTN